MLSGAYAVLEGAPAIVSAVDRYVVAERRELPPRRRRRCARRSAARRRRGSTLPRCSPRASRSSVSARARRSWSPAWRREARRASAATLADTELAAPVSSARARRARRAQGGGSGVDVAASAFGGTIVFRRGQANARQALTVALPDGSCIEVWWSGRPASTSELIGRVDALARARRRALREAHRRAGGRAARRGAAPCQRGGRAFVSARARRAAAALDALGAPRGRRSSTTRRGRSRDAAAALGGAALPAGAGGGDVLVFAGLAPSPPELRGARRPLRLRAARALPRRARRPRAYSAVGVTPMTRRFAHPRLLSALDRRAARARERAHRRRARRSGRRARGRRPRSRDAPTSSSRTCSARTACRSASRSTCA